MEDLPKSLQQLIFSFAGPPTSPTAELVKTSEFQRARRDIIWEWIKEEFIQTKLIYRDLDFTENMAMEAMYSRMLHNVWERDHLDDSSSSDSDGDSDWEYYSREKSIIAHLWRDLETE